MNFLRQSFGVALISALPLTQSHGAPPVAYDSWKSSAGGVSSACPSGFSCIENGYDKDMMQRILWSQNGQRYVQTIVDSVGSDKTRLTSESFVNATNNAAQGISVKQTISTPGADPMTSIAIINTGWADDAGTPSIQLEQTQKSSYKGVGYGSRFIYEGNLDKNGNTTGYYLDIRQEVSNSTAISSTTKASGQDLHVFVTRKLGGDRVTGGSASLPTSAQGMMGGGGGGMAGGMAGTSPTGGSVSWKTGDEIQVIWIGQSCSGCQSSSGMMMGGGMGMALGGSNFSYQSYDNLKDGSAAINTRNFTTSPINWQGAFGASPSFSGGTASTISSAPAKTAAGPVGTAMTIDVLRSNTVSNTATNTSIATKTITPALNETMITDTNTVKTTRGRKFTSTKTATSSSGSIAGLTSTANIPASTYAPAPILTAPSTGPGNNNPAIAGLIPTPTAGPVVASPTVAPPAPTTTTTTTTTGTTPTTTTGGMGSTTTTTPTTTTTTTPTTTTTTTPTTTTTTRRRM